MMGDPKFLEFMQKALDAGDDPDDATVEEMVKSLDAVGGVTMETKEEITVKIE